MKFECQHCGQRLAIGTLHAGAQVNCTHCQQALVVPQTQTADCRPQTTDTEEDNAGVTMVQGGGGGSAGASPLAGQASPSRGMSDGSAELPHLPGGRGPEALSAVTMKALAISAAAVFLTVVIGSAADSIRMALDLDDGSHLLGVPTIESIPLSTSYAQMRIPLNKIRRIVFSAERDTVLVELENGDSMTGISEIPPLDIETLFGRIQIPINSVSRITVVYGEGAGRLVLHYTFDGDEPDTVFDSSGNRHHGELYGRISYEPAVSGRGIVTAARDQFVLCDSKALNLHGWRELTVTGWIKVQHHNTHGILASRGGSGRHGAFNFAIGGISRGRPANCYFEVRLQGLDQPLKVEGESFSEIGQWAHIAGVYDGHTLRYYVNGALHASQNVPRAHLNAGLHDEPGFDLLIGQCAVRRTWSDTHFAGTIDEIMLFSRALTPAQVQSLYLAVK